MQFSSKKGLRICDDCSFTHWDIASKDEKGKEAICLRCGYCDFFIWRRDFWEGEKDRYLKDIAHY